MFLKTSKRPPIRLVACIKISDRWYKTPAGNGTMFKAFADSGLEIVSLVLLALTCTQSCLGTQGDQGESLCPWLTASPATDLPLDAADVRVVAEKTSATRLT